MNFWAPDNLARVTGGTWVRACGAGWTPGCKDAATLSSDTRTIQPGQIFVAIAGEQFDGNTMVGEAAAKGARMAVVDAADALPAELPQGFGVLLVDCTRRALGHLAAEYRRTVLGGTCIIAVCGSNGKTTTVRMLDAVLSQGLCGRASQKSFNNDIGVPLTILSAAADDEYLICEVGTNAPGEIAALAAIVRPDIAVITNIGREHLEKLSSLEGVAMEESRVLEFLSKTSMHADRAARANSQRFRTPLAVVYADSLELQEAIARQRLQPRNLVRFGTSAGAELNIRTIAYEPEGVTFTLSDSEHGQVSFVLPMLGRHNAFNAAAAVAVGRALALTDRQIAAGLAGAEAPEMRLQRSEVNGSTIVNDAYNANPDSMCAALATLHEIGADADRRVLFMADMLELGEHSEAFHREVVEAAASLPTLDLLVLIGPAMHAAAESLGLLVRPEVVLMADLDDGRAKEAAELLRPGDCALLKGSRRMRLERILSAARRLAAESDMLER